MNQKNYIAFMSRLSGPKPPCIQCHWISYNNCKDHELDCSAFRTYCNSKKYKDHQIGKFKRHFKEIDNEP